MDGPIGRTQWTVRHQFRTAAAILAAAVIALVAVFGGTMAAGAAPDTTADDTLPPFAVENFAYPEPEQPGFRLLRGDGHIILVACTSGEANLRFSARNQDGNICFRVTGPTGYLAVDIPSVNGVRTGDFEAHVTLTVGEEATTYEAAPNVWTPVGEGVQGQPEATLVEIRVP